MKKTSAQISVLLAFLVTAPAAKAAGNFYINTFDYDAAIPANIDGGGQWKSALMWDGAQNAGGPAGGSLYTVVDWDSHSNWEDSKLNFDIGIYGINAAPFANLEFDIKIDTAFSVLGGDGTYGWVQAVVQNWNWYVADMVTLDNSSGWQHISAPIPELDPNTIYRVVINLASNGSNHPQGPVGYWLDNIVLTVPEPSSFALFALGILGFARRKSGRP
jgi:hypothetical protein